MNNEDPRSLKEQLRGIFVPDGMVLWPEIIEAELRGMDPLRE